MLIRLSKGIFLDLSTIYRHWKSEGTAKTFRWLHSKEAPVTVQFAKYVIAGLATTVLHLGAFTILSHTIFPAHDYLVEGGIEDAVKEHNSILSNLVAYPFCNILAYFLNTWFVFTTGRHSRWREFLLFSVISFFSFAVGLFSGPVLISKGLNPWLAQLGLMVSSAIVNFASRKFLIFLK